MRATGIVRRVDDLNRIVLPKEICRTMRIKAGDPLEIFVNGDAVCFKKYSPMHDVAEFAMSYVEALSKVTFCPFCITDVDTVVAVYGVSKKRDVMDKCIKENIGDIIRERDTFSSTTERLNFIKDSNSFNTSVIVPIISDGDGIGSIIMINDGKCQIDEIKIQLMKTAALFIGKYLECN